MVNWKNVFRNPGLIIGSLIAIIILLNININRLPDINPPVSPITTLISLAILAIALIIGYIHYWKSHKTAFIIWGLISVFAVMLLLLFNASNASSYSRTSGYVIFTIPLIMTGLIDRNNNFLPALFFVITTAGYGVLVNHLFNKIKNNILKHLFLVSSIFAYMIINYFILFLLWYGSAFLYGSYT